MYNIVLTQRVYGVTNVRPGNIQYWPDMAYITHRNAVNNIVSLPLFTNTGTPSRRLEFCTVADTVIRALGRIRWLAHHKKRVITLSILSGSSLNLLPLMPQQSGDSCSTSHALVLDPVRLFTERTNKTRVRPGYEQHKQAQYSPRRQV